MNTMTLQNILPYIQHGVSAIGIIIILTGVVLAVAQYLYLLFSGLLIKQENRINLIRLNLGRILILGLEFIVAADLMGTISAPDYYSVGILAIIVVIRTLLSFSLSREIMGLTQNPQQ